MRTTVFVLLAFSLFVSSIGDLCDYGYYLVNKTFISNNLCINRSTKDIRCQGKCFLISNIKENKDQSEDDSKPIINLECKWQIFASIEMFTLSEEALCNDQNYDLARLFTELWIASIFHPPQFIATI